MKNSSVLLGEEVSASPLSVAALRTEVHDAKIRILLEAALCPKIIQMDSTGPFSIVCSHSDT